MNKIIQITIEEKQQLEDRLDHLKLVKRPEVVERIKIARSYGDLSENSEYEAAKDEQLFIEKQIAEIEEQLRYAEIINVDSISDDIISIGKTVEFKCLDNNEIITVHLVGNTAVNIFENKISKESPVGFALNGCSKGDIVHINTPVKAESYDVKILNITKTNKKAG